MIPALNNLLRLRLKQSWRFFTELPWLHRLLVVLLAAIFLTAYYYWTDEATDALKAYALLLLGILQIHFTRPDRQWLFTHFDRPQFIQALEYALPVVLFMPGTLGHSHWYYGLVAMLMAAGISLIPVAPLRSTWKLHFLTRRLAAHHFEWKAGLRRYGWLLFIIWVAGVLGSSLPFVSLLAIWFFTLITAAFYQECEPLPVLFAEGKSPRAFFRQKLLRETRLYLLVTAPMWLLNVVFQPNNIWATLIVAFLCVLNYMLAIAVKYSAYYPGEKVNHGSIFLSLAYLGAVVPFFTPLPPILLIRYYRTALSHLQHYLHDFH